MALETGTFISDLVVTNPAHTDGLNNADAHMRLIKSTIKATFPNINGAVSSTQTQLDAAVTASVSGSGVLKDTGEFFKTNVFDGITNPAQGTVAINVTNSGDTATVVGAAFTSTLATLPATAIAGNSAIGGNETVAGTLAVTGGIASTGPITGPGSVPVGGMVMWLSDTLPADGSWCWANGGTLSRTGTGAALFALWGTSFGVGDGSTTFNVKNMQEVVPVGKSTMGGASSPGLLPGIISGLKASLNAIFGSDSKSLVTANLPAYTPTGTIVLSGGGTIPIQGSSRGAPLTSAAAWGGNDTGIVDLPFDHNPSYHFVGDAQGGSSTAFEIVQPSAVVNFIIRFK